MEDGNGPNGRKAAEHPAQARQKVGNPFAPVAACSGDDVSPMSERWGWTSAFGGMRMAFGRVKETKERGE